MILSQPSSDQWWSSAVIYQIYPRSFKSTTDGVGDLPGITSKLPYLAGLGVDAVWISPFYTSPQKDHGYDVSDYRDVDPLFGTLEDATTLLARAKELGIKVIVDLVPNHTSDQHPWFQKALKAGPGSPERNLYWFRDGRGENGELPPTNWRSVFGGPAWTQVEDGQWYLHLFDSSQPDLNWENPLVREEFESILRFWLERGVAGFRVDVAHGLMKDPALPDWDHDWEMVSGLDDDSVPAPPMWDRDEVHDIYRDWRKIVDSYGGMMCAEAWVHDDERRSLYVRPDEFQQCFNFSFLASPWDRASLQEVIAQSYEVNNRVGAPTTWVFNNHDVVRLPSRMGLPVTGKGPNGIFPTDPQPDLELGSRRARAAQLLMLALPGSAYLYNGEELGLPEHTSLADEYRQDPNFRRTEGTEAGRDGCRIPLPWDSTLPGAGFSPTGETWLPQPDGWEEYAPDRQIVNPDSVHTMITTALKLRKEHGLGTAQIKDHTTEDALEYQVGDIRVITAFDRELPVPDGWQVLLSSQPVTDTIGPNTTCWLQKTES
ncbi:glycoside hydrolase family 13 protein [Flaviflexus massiliensis]|uniref:glycoside hydrolase family 13 protein n=1 Tax=Flaviflexus massiliensis TaxID=1522309 RepID=UPI0006D556D6|nr:glycoside hydrolase family 13 protein [Flaviflexus massiliensis]